MKAWLGPLLAVLGVLGFSFKAILIKLAYAAAPVDPVTLLTLRMLYSAPFFVALAWWAGRAKGAAPIAPRDFRLLLALGFIGYYLSSLLDFLGLQYITASLGVGCDFCHVTGPGGAFDKDDKEPKGRAREMMKMMTAINKSMAGKGSLVGWQWVFLIGKADLLASYVV